MSAYEEQCTVKQLNYAKTLAQELGIEDQYEWIASKYTKRDMSRLIDKLNKRLGKKHPWNTNE
jgi:hypothetical protein